MTERKTLLEFPCEFTIKVFGKHAPECHAETRKIIDKHFPELQDNNIEIKDSKKGNYCAINITVTAQSQEQLDAAYTDLSSCPDIIMVL